jgi:hypothetical protein
MEWKRLMLQNSGRISEFEFNDPSVLADYVSMPRRIAKMEYQLEKLMEFHKLQQPN